MRRNNVRYKEFKGFEYKFKSQKKLIILDSEMKNDFENISYYRILMSYVTK